MKQPREIFMNAGYIEMGLESFCLTNGLDGPSL